ncbi:hypothetical protein HDU81_007616 [Chytriomyces hyalinus]|nr:hypothetical protein HDU81_007616 [Chytriomyces hyalinus]
MQQTAAGIDEAVTLWDVVNTLRLAVEGTLPARESNSTDLLSAPLSDQSVSQHELKTEQPPISSTDIPVALEVLLLDEGPSSDVPPASNAVPVAFDVLPQDERSSSSAVPAPFSSDDRLVVLDGLPQDKGLSCSVALPPLQSLTIKMESDAAVAAPSVVLPPLQGLTTKTDCNTAVAAPSVVLPPLQSVIKMESDAAAAAPTNTEKPNVKLIPRPINPYQTYRSKRSNETLARVLEERFKTEHSLKIKIDAFLQMHPTTDLMNAMWYCMDASEQQMHHDEFNEELRQFTMQQKAIETGELLGFVGSNEDASSTKVSTQSKKRGRVTNAKQEQTLTQTKMPTSAIPPPAQTVTIKTESDAAVAAPKMTAKRRAKKEHRSPNSYHFFRSTTSNEVLVSVLEERFKTEPHLKIKIDAFRKLHPSRDLMNAFWNCMDVSEQQGYRNECTKLVAKNKQEQKALADAGPLTFEDSNDGASSSGLKRSRETTVKQEPASKRTSSPTSKSSLDTSLGPSLEPDRLPMPPIMPSSSHPCIVPTVQQAPTTASRDNNNCNIFHMNASFQTPSVPSGSHPWQAQRMVPHPMNGLPTAYPWPVASPHPIAQGNWMWNPADMWANQFASMMMSQATFQQQMLGLSFPQQSIDGPMNSSATRNPFSFGFGLDQQSDEFASIRNSWLHSIGQAAQGNADKVGSSSPPRAVQIRNGNQDASASSGATKQETNDSACVPDAAKCAAKSGGAMSELSLAQFLKASAAEKKNGLSADGISQAKLNGKELAWDDPDNEGHVFTVPDYEMTQEVEQAQPLDRYSMQFPVDKGQNVPVIKMETKPKPRPKRRVATRQSKPEDGGNSSAVTPATSTPKKGQGRSNKDVDGTSEQERLRAENAFLLRELERLSK